MNVKSLGGTGKINPEIRSLHCDSRTVEADSLFFAIQGEQTDGHFYIEKALEQGAVAIISERRPPADANCPWIQIKSIRPVMAQLANTFYGLPSENLDLIGVTGTNGKTSVSFLVHSIFEQRSPSLLMSTVHVQMGNRQLLTSLTTPDPIQVQKRMSEAVECGCNNGVVETSSHGIYQYRLYQCHFRVVIFTNLSRDHLDFHSNLEDYFRAKCLIFQTEYNPGLEYAVLNSDDPYSIRVPLQEGIERVTFGSSENCDVYPLSYRTSIEGTETELSFFNRRLLLKSPLAGDHNLSNIMSAATAASLIGMTDDEICKGVGNLCGVPGRFEKIPLDLPFQIVVDYAHTPDALKHVLQLCRQLTPERVLCVFGCGGDRDRGKRPLMGEVAARHSDYFILTSDNPRWEDKTRIIQDIQGGIPSDINNYTTILDRKEAIARALGIAREGDIILIAGKGHETYQMVRGEKLPFDDRKVIREIQ